MTERVGCSGSSTPGSLSEGGGEESTQGSAVCKVFHTKKNNDKNILSSFFFGFENFLVLWIFESPFLAPLAPLYSNTFSLK